MRFRPLGNTGMVVSALSVALADSPTLARPQDWEAFVYSALENGVNCFEVTGRQTAIGDGLAHAIHAIERRLACVCWRLGNVKDERGIPVRDFSAQGLENSIMAILARTGFDYLDAIILDEPRAEELNTDALTRLKDLRAAGRVRLLGVSGVDPAIDAYITTGVFDLLSTPFNLLSGWKDRQRLAAAMAQDMAVIAYDTYPDRLRGGLAGQTRKGPTIKRGMFGTDDKPLSGAGTYAFLDATPKWTGEQICLAYALTNPALASVQVTTDRAKALADLAEITEMDLPPGASAQIEMARFGRGTAADLAAGG